MSRNFSAGGYQGDLGLGYEVTGYPVSFGCWIKAHPGTINLLLAMNPAWNQRDDSHHITSDDAVANRWFGNTRTTANNFCLPVYDPNAQWTPVLYVCRSATDRQLYVGDQSATNATSAAISNLRYLGIGRNGFTSGWSGLLAEAAFWSNDLSGADVTSFLGGTMPSDIDSANLIAYYSLEADGGHLTDESGNAGPTLTIRDTEPTYSEDHPTITSTASVLSTQPLYYISTLLQNKTGIRWKVITGYPTNLVGAVLGSGSAGTTNNSGVFTPDGTHNFGSPSDEVTLFLYWEEGDPAVDRSLIVKTTLVAE